MLFRSLFEECRKVNPRTYLVSDGSNLDMSLLEGAEKIGICGATSTPRWLMAEVAQAIK